MSANELPDLHETQDIMEPRGRVPSVRYIGVAFGFYAGFAIISGIVAVIALTAIAFPIYAGAFAAGVFCAIIAAKLWKRTRFSALVDYVKHYVRYGLVSHRPAH